MRDTFAARAEIAIGFRRSRKGNLWRTWEGRTVTVFKRADGWWGWPIAGKETKRFGRERFEPAEKALGAVAR